MEVQEMFQMVNAMVLPGWLVLAVFPRRSWRNTVIYSLAIVLALIYGFYIITGLPSFDLSAFSTLYSVKQLFTMDQVVLAGWVHYLVFDLLVGNWVVNQSVRHRIKHYWIIPCLLFCFMFGPLGYLLFTLIRVLKTKSFA